MGGGSLTHLPPRIHYGPGNRKGFSLPRTEKHFMDIRDTRLIMLYHYYLSYENTVSKQYQNTKLHWMGVHLFDILYSLTDP